MIDVVPAGPFRVNTLVVHLEGPFVFIVDPAGSDFSGDNYKLSQFLEQQNLKVVLVLLTHGHFDHIGGLKKIATDFPEAPVLIHEKDSDFIGPDSEILQERSLKLMGFEEFLPYVSDLPAPDAFLSDGKSLWDCLASIKGKSFSSYGPGVKKALSLWQVMSTPGHSPGSVCLYNKEERTLISGDTVFYQSYGRTDLPGGDESTIIKSLKKIYHNLPKETLVYPGHDYCGFMLQDNL